MYFPTRHLKQLATLMLMALVIVLLTGPAGLRPTPANATDPPPAPAPGDFVPADGRLLDTTSGTGGYTTQMPAGQWRSLQVGGQLQVPASGVDSVLIRVSSVSATTNGLVSSSTTSSNAGAAVIASYGAQDNQTTEAVVRLNASGVVYLRASTAVHLTVDVAGYFVAASGSSPTGFKSISPVTIGQTTLDSASEELDVSALTSVPANASSAFLSVTVSNQSETGTVTVGPADMSVADRTGAFDSTNAVTFGMQVSLGSSFSPQFGNVSVGIYGAAADVSISVFGYATSPSTAAGQFQATNGSVYSTDDLSSENGYADAGVPFDVQGIAGVPESDVSAITLHVDIVSEIRGRRGSVEIVTEGSGEGRSVIPFGPGKTSASLTLPTGYAGRLRVTSMAIVSLEVQVEGWYGKTDGGTVVGNSIGFDDGSAVAIMNDDQVMIPALVADGSASQAQDYVEGGSTTNAGIDALGNRYDDISTLPPGDYDGDGQVDPAGDPVNATPDGTDDDVPFPGTEMQRRTDTPRGFALWGTSRPSPYRYISDLVYWEVIECKFPVIRKGCSIVQTIRARFSMDLQSGASAQSTSYRWTISVTLAKTSGKGTIGGQATYWCGINIPNATDQTCRTDDATADPSGEILGLGRLSSGSVTRVYDNRSFGNAWRTYQKFPMVRISVSSSYDPYFGLQDASLRGWDIKRTGSIWKIAPTTGNGD